MISSKLKFNTILQSSNLAEHLSDEDLTHIARRCVEDLEIDRMSRSEWDQKTKEALDIAKQVTAGDAQVGKADVKYPLITIAAIQYAARAYPEFIRNNRVVNCATTGLDPEGIKEQRAKRISDHMSWQMLIESKEWEKGFDKLLHVLPIIGTVFTKTYYDPIQEQNCSDLCLPDCLFVNQHIKSLDTARRISHITYCYENDLIEQMRYGLFLEDLDIFKTKSTMDYTSPITDKSTINPQDDDAPRAILEQHRYLDLDGDGYQEPYIVTVDLASRKVLRIYRRFEPDHYDAVGKKIRRILPTHYFTDFHFIPSPDGTFMSYGFGQLLLPVNETINSTINQLLDAGTLSNRQSVFLAREVRLQKGKKEINPGELITTDCPAEYLKGGIVPLPVRDPSAVLFQLLGQMVDSGKQLSSITEVLQGQIPTQNSSPTTVLAMVEQGLKPFSAIQKRTYRSLKDQFKKWYDLNAKYLNAESYFRLSGTPQAIAQLDYQSNDYDVMPIADPSMSSDAQRMARAQALMTAIQMLPPQGRQYALRIWMDALQFPESQVLKLVPDPDPAEPPPPEMVKMMAEAGLIQAKQQREFADVQLKQADLEIQGRLAEVQQQLANIRQQEINLKAEAEKNQLIIKQYEKDRADTQMAAQRYHDRIKHDDKMLLDAYKIDQEQIMKEKDVKVKKAEIAAKGASHE